VLKSRRGLLAAGLAVAVVGALGVASTLNAGAEQIAGAPDQEPVAAAPTSSDNLALGWRLDERHLRRVRLAQVGWQLISC